MWFVIFFVHDFIETVSFSLYFYSCFWQKFLICIEIVELATSFRFIWTETGRKWPKIKIRKILPERIWDFFSLLPVCDLYLISDDQNVIIIIINSHTIRKGKHINWMSRNYAPIVILILYAIEEKKLMQIWCFVIIVIVVMSSPWLLHYSVGFHEFLFIDFCVENLWQCAYMSKMFRVCSECHRAENSIFFAPNQYAFLLPTDPSVGLIC